MSAKNPMIIELGSDDALTLAYALSVAYALAQGIDHEGWLDSFKVRIAMRGQGDADAEGEVARIMERLGYEF